MRAGFFLSLSWLLAGALIPVHAAERAPHVQAELQSERTVLAPGLNTLAIKLTPEAGWHTYWKNPGDAGQATELKWSLPAGFSAGPIQWPVPKAFVAAGVNNLGYDREIWHLVEVQIPDSAMGQSVALHVTAHWLACADACVPEQAELFLQRAIASLPQPDETLAAQFQAARTRLPKPWKGRATYQHTGQSVSLRLDGISAAEDTQFLPAAEAIFDLARPAQLHRDGDTLELELALLPDATLPAGALEGLLLAGDGGQAWDIRAEPQSAVAETSYLLILLLAFAGGLVLNLMPCVFPVLSIKAVSLLQGAAHIAEQRRHALVYTAGVVLSCIAAAAALLLLRAGGEALGWGFQLQSPFFVGLLAYLMFVLALSMSGALEIGGGLMGLGQNLATRAGYAGSFFTGVLAVVVASPCTAPFMGTALGYAMTQSWLLALGIFAGLGLGLASPFLVLAWWPAAARRLPRPGAWMETFKQLMAFPLYFTVVWLLWVLGRQVGLAALVAALSGLVLVALAVWGLARPGWVRRLLAPAAAAASLLALAAPAQTAPVAPDQVHSAWETYSDTRLAELQAEGRTVFVNLTADWCITCKVNERVALETDSTHAAFRDKQIALLKGDWTRSDPAITAVLAHYGRNGVPLYLVFTPGREPQLLPQLLTPGLIASALGDSAP